MDAYDRQDDLSKAIAAGGQSSQDRGKAAAALDTPPQPTVLDAAIEAEMREEIETQKRMNAHLNQRIDNFADQTSDAILKGPFIIAMRAAIEALEAIALDGDITLPGDLDTAREHLRQALLQIYSTPSYMEKDSSAREIGTFVLSEYITFASRARRGGYAP